MTMTSQDASISAANTLLNNFSVGNQIVIWAGKTDATKKKLFRGIVESLIVKEPNKNYFDIEIEGPDWGSDILKSRVVNGQWIQAKQADGVTLDNTDNTVLVKNIVYDLLTKEMAYPTNEYPVEDQGVVVDLANITPPDLRLSQFNANMEILEDKLLEIDKLVGTLHYIDADKNFIMRQPEISASSTPATLLLTDDYSDSVALGWDQTKLGLIQPATTYKQTLEEHYRRLFGLGGDQINKDQYQETNTTSTALDANYLAQKFTPIYRHCDSLGVYISKTGSPVVGLTLELVEDNGGNPTGTILRTVSKQPTSIGSANWHYFKIGEDLNTSKSYWIIIRRVNDASNTYNWFRNGGTSHTNAYSADGVSWTVQASSYGFMFRQYTKSPILTVLADLAPITSKHYHEAIFRKADITESRVMWQLLRQEAQLLFKRKDILTMPVYAPDTLLQTGQKVRIRKTASGYQVDDDFILSNIEYNFLSSEDLQTGTMSYTVDAVKYASL